MNAGEIRGSVKDTSGAVVPGVEVTIRNQDTGVTINTSTNSSGEYDVPFVPLGEYSVTFSKEGFMRVVRTGISLQLGTTAVNAILQVGSVSTKITVKGAPSLLQTETSAGSTSLTGPVVTELPNEGQDWTNLTGLVPGIAGQGEARSWYSSVNGSETARSLVLVDGGTVTYPVSSDLGENYNVPLDAVAEVNVLTDNFSAQYGTGTSVFNMITKSGTNQFHGSAFEFDQNSALEARTFFAPTIPPLRWNLFGGSLGGPIKRDKAFFFFSYERNPESTPFTEFYTFPTAAARSGDFSATGYPTIYNPNSTIYLSNGSARRTAFPGNIIPRADIDPVAAKVQQFYPLPNLPGLVDNYLDSSIPDYGTVNYFVPRVDYNLSSANHLSLSGEVVTNPLFVGDATCPLTCYNDDIHDQRWNLTDNWIFSPTFIGEFHMNAIRYTRGPQSPTVGKGYPQQLGLMNAPANIFPTFAASGVIPMTTLAPAPTAVFAEGSYDPSGLLTLVKGKHVIKFGGEYDRFYLNYDNWGDQSAGNFSFSGIFTRNPLDSSSTGLGYADLLLGLPETWSATEYPVTGQRSWSTQYFIQDDYKLKPRLTVNMGIRYTIQAGWGEVYNRFGDFDPTLTNPATHTPGAMFFGETGSGRTALQNTSYNNWAPRIGFAWSPRNNWVIRGAYGIFDVMWDSNNYTYGGIGVGIDPTGFETSTNLITPIFKLSQGEPSLIYPKLSSLSPSIFNGQSITYLPPNPPMEYVQQAHFDVQHQFAGFLADASFVWTRGIHLLFTTDLNQVPAKLLGPGNAQSRRAYPQYQNIAYDANGGWSNYDSLQLSLKRNFSHGLSLITNYTWAKAMDTGTASGFGSAAIDYWQIAEDPSANYGLSANDMPQMLNGGLVYDLPFGAGKTFLPHGRLLNALASGWEISSVFQFHSGLPFPITMATANLSGSLAGSWFPNRVGNGGLSNPTIQTWFNVNAFMEPTPFTFGNSGRNLLLGPGYEDMDWSLAKSFAVRPLGEGARLQFRADAFNAFNHANFGQPYGGVGSPAAGRIFSANSGRVIQLGAKLSF